MKKKRTWYLIYLYGLAGFVFLFFVWWLASYLMKANGNNLLPGPFETLPVFFAKLFGAGAGSTYVAIGWTLLRIIIGFVASFILGALLGTLAGLHPGLEKFMAPYVVFSRSVPTASFVVILVGIFYEFSGLPPYIPCFLVFLVAFPLIYEAFVKGIRSESSDIKDALRLDVGEKTFQAVVAVEWPDSWDYIVLAIAQSLGLSVKVSIMSEILVNSSSAKGGLGGLIQMAWQIDFDMKSVIAYSLISVLLVLVMDIPLSVLKHQVQKKIS
jgi:NitT/TauT family transport system permease protein